MKEETKTKIAALIKEWTYRDSLPTEWHGFRLNCVERVTEDRYELYSYTNEACQKSVTVYYHEETREYKVRQRVGLIEFCRIEFITSDFAAFEKLLREHFEGLLLSLSSFAASSVSSLAKAKGIMDWAYGDTLPEELEGFRLFIRPREPLPITNGSYILIDYSDFAIASNFIIYYNMYRDEFCGEARVRRIPDVSYSFDSTTLTELEEKLSLHLIPRLQEVRRRAEEE